MANKKIITSTFNQTIFDLALQEYGSVEGVITIIQENGLESVNDNIESGDEFVVLLNSAINKDVLSEYAKRKIKPATADHDSGTPDEYAFTTGFTLGFES